MEFSRDDVRRKLAETRRAQTEAMPRWREAVARVFDPKASCSTGAKQAVLGLPDRRAFLRVGGLTVAMSAVIAACGSDDDESLPITGTPPTSSEDASVFERGQELDVTLLRTAQSIEVLAVDTYQTALDSGLVTTTVVADTIRLFQEQHREHAFFRLLKLLPLPFKIGFFGLQIGDAGAQLCHIVGSIGLCCLHKAGGRLQNLGGHL